MKTNQFFIFVISLLLQTAAFAQDHKPATPAWVSDKGYWVVESNIHDSKLHIVYFYNTGGILVYKEKVEGLRINPAKRATKMLLKQVLESSVLAWEKQHSVKENEALVETRLRNK